MEPSPRNNVETKARTTDFYDRNAKNWNKQFWVNSKAYNDEIKDFAGFTDSETKLDVGIGSGEIEKRFLLRNTTGIDISPNMILECMNTIPPKLGTILYVSDAETLPFDDGTFDVVFCRNYLQNFDDPSGPLKEMFRVARHRVLVFESAVDERLVDIITRGVRVVEPHHPRFPSFTFLMDKFLENTRNFDVRIISYNKAWLQNWCSAKGATKEQMMEVLSIYKNAPEWFKTANDVVIDERAPEVETRTDYMLIKSTKNGEEQTASHVRDPMYDGVDWDNFDFQQLCGMEKEENANSER